MLSSSSSNVLTMCCLYFSTSFMWSFKHRFLPWNRDEVRRFTSEPQTSHVTFPIPQVRQILPTPITMGNVPAVDSSFPHMAHFIILPVECCMAFHRENWEALKTISPELRHRRDASTLRTTQVVGLARLNPVPRPL